MLKKLMLKIILKNYNIFKKYCFLLILKMHILRMGIGDWGLGIGDWGLGPIPNPQRIILFQIFY